MTELVFSISEQLIHEKHIEIEMTPDQLRTFLEAQLRRELGLEFSDAKFDIQFNTELDEWEDHRFTGMTGNIVVGLGK